MAINACGACRHCRQRSIAGGFGNPPRGPMAMTNESTGTGQDLVRSFDSLSAEFSAEIADLRTEEEIRLAQARYLGKKGKATELMKLLGRIPAAERPMVGAAANRARETIEGLVEARLAGLANEALAAELSRSIDV